MKSKAKTKISIFLAILIVVLCGIFIFNNIQNTLISSKSGEEQGSLIAIDTRVGVRIWNNEILDTTPYTVGSAKNVIGEIVLTETSNNSKKYRNGFCMDRGKELWGWSEPKYSTQLYYIESAYSKYSKEIKWLYDNICLPFSNDENEKNFYKENLKRIFEKYGYKWNSSFTEYQIYEVEQCAFWYFTNGYDYREEFTTTGQKELFVALISEAINATKNGYTSTGGKEVSIENNNAEIDVKENTWEIGPFTLNNPNGNLVNLSVGDFKLNGTQITGVKISDYNDNNIAGYTNYNGSFKIKFQSDCKPGTDYKISDLKITANNYTTAANLWENGQDMYQPVVNLERTVNKLEENYSGTYKMEQNKGLYVITLKKESTAENKEGEAKFKFNEGSLNSEDINKTVKIGSKVILTAKNINNVNKDIYFIEEIGTSGNYDIGDGNIYKIVVNKEKKDDGYRVKSCGIYDATYDVNTNDRIMDIKSGEEYNTSNFCVAVNEQGSRTDITITYKNPPKGKYNLSIVKKSTKSNTSYDNYSDALGGAKFKIDHYPFEIDSIAGNRAYIVKDMEITDCTDDKYTIEEIKAPDGYKIPDGNGKVSIRVVKEFNNTKGYIISNVFVKTENMESEIDAKVAPNINDYIRIDYDERNIQVTYKDEPIVGQYELDIVKKSTESTTDRTDLSDALGGAEYQITQRLDEMFNESSDKTTVTTKTSETGNFKMENVEPLKTYVHYIREIKAPAGYKLYNDDNKFLALKVVVKTAVSENNTVTIENMYVSVIYKDNNNALLEKELKIIDNECSFYDGKVIIRLLGSNKIQVTFKNEPNPYELELQKVSSNDTNKTLPNTELAIGTGFNNTSEINLNENNAKYEDTGLIDSDSKTYWIEEKNPQNGYKNIFGTNKVKLVINFKEGKINNIEKGIYSSEKNKLDENENKELYDMVDTSIEENGAKVKVIIKNPEEKFDLALRKFITQINGTNTQNRVPTFDKTTTVESLNKNHSIEYKHKKNALEVKKGDSVIYTIRVYNEGNMDGYVGEIKDYLPDGLEFESSNVDGVDYKWEKVNDREIKTNYLKDTLLYKNALTNNTNERWYADVKVKCKVVKEPESNTVYLTNRAEITAHKDILGRQYGTYYNAQTNTDIDSTPDTIKNSLDLSNYYSKKVLNSTNGENGDYYPGVQDDDDFETVKLAPVRDFEFKLNKISVNTENKDLGNTDAKFKVKEISKEEYNGNLNDISLNDVPEKATTNGILEIGGKQNVELNTSYYYLVEEQSPLDNEHEIIYKKVGVKINVTANGDITAEIGKVYGADNKEVSDRNNNLISIQTNENTVTLKIANRKKKDVSLQLTKTDENGNNINGAKFNISKDSNVKWENEVINGISNYKDEKVEYNKVIKYIFEEKNAPDGYKNVLEKCKIVVPIIVNRAGGFKSGDKVDSTNIENGRQYYIQDENGNKLPTDSILYNYVEVEINEINNEPAILVKVKNPQVRDFKFELNKISVNTENKNLGNTDAKFKFKEIFKEQYNDDLRNISLDDISEKATTNGILEIGGKQNVELNTSYYYLVEEQEQEPEPVNNEHEIIYKRVGVKINVTSTGNITAEIGKVYGADNKEVSDRNNNLISIQTNGNIVTLKIANRKKKDVSLQLTKTDENGNNINGAKFNISKISKNSNVKWENEEIKGISNYKDEKVKYDEVIKYIFEEKKAPDGYKNVLGNCKIIVPIIVNRAGGFKSGNDVDSTNIENGRQYYIQDESGNKLPTDNILYNYVEVEINEINNEPAIFVKVKNPKKPDIHINLRKVNESGENISGAEFTCNKNGESVFTGEIIGENGKSITDNIDYDTEYTYEFNEINAPTGYRNILGVENKIQVKFKCPLDKGGAIDLEYENEKGFIIVDEFGNKLNYSGNEELYDSVGVFPVGSMIYVTVINERITNYELQIQKVDANDENTKLIDTMFTITGPDDGVILKNGEIGENYTYKQENVKANTTYTYTIKEEKAKDGYINEFVVDGEKLDIKFDVVIDDNGKIDKKAVENSISLYKGQEEYIWQDLAGCIAKLKLIKIDVDEETNTVKLIIKNPKITTDFKFNLSKKSLDGNSYIRNAKFDIERKINKDGNYETYKKDVISGSNPVLIDEVNSITAGNTYYYKVTETATANLNYEKLNYTAYVRIQVDANGNVTGNMIDESGNVIQNEIPDVAHLSTDGNSFTLTMTNKAKYKMSLYKLGDGGERIYNDGSSFSVYKKVINGGVETKELIKKSSPYDDFLTNEDVSPNSEYVYYIKEETAPSGYNNDFENIWIILTLRTDADANVIEDESSIEFEREDGQELSLRENILLLKKCKLEVIPAQEGYYQDVRLKITDTKKEEPDQNYYNIQIVKSDKNYSKKEINDVGFNVKLTNPNKHLDRQNYDIKTGRQYLINKNNPSTFENEEGTNGIQGIAEIKNIEIGTESNFTDRYIIQETTTPEGYKVFTDYYIQFDVTSEDGKNVSIENLYLGRNGNTSEYDQDYISAEVKNKTIYIYIPNEQNTFQFKLMKTDMQGNEIKATKDNNGNIVDGVNMNINSNYGYIFNGILEDGNILDTVDLEKSPQKVYFDGDTRYIYRYIISENDAKIGYSNVFKDHNIVLTIVLDKNGNILTGTTDGTILPKDSNKSEYEVSSYVVNKLGANQSIVTEKFANFINAKMEWKNGIQIAILNMKNPTGYKVRLNKVDTDNNPVIVANLEAQLNGERKCALNIARNEGTGSDELFTGNSTATSEEYISIVPRETQEWKIYERGVNSPYVNVFDRKYIEVTVKMDDSGVLSVLNYTIKNDDESDLTQEELTKLKTYIGGINFNNEDGTNILNITLKNPMKFKFNITKVDADGTTELKGANISLKADNSEYEDVIDMGASQFVETYTTNVGTVHSFTIKENYTTSNNTNVFKDKFINIRFVLNKEGEFDYVLIGIYEDENLTKLIDRRNDIYNYISHEVTTETNGENKIPVLNIKITNPRKFKLKLNKTDANGNPIEGVIFDINGVKTEGQSSYELTKDSVKAKDTVTFSIQEVTTPAPYVNVIGKNNKLRIVTRVTEDLTVQVINTSIYNTLTGESKIIDYNNPNPYINIRSTSENGIPGIEVNIKNPMQYKIRLNKLKTNESILYGANLIIENTEDDIEYSTEGKARFEITCDDVYIGQVKEFEIYEKSTVFPYVNILGENRHIKLKTMMNSNKKVEVIECNIVDNNGEEISEVDRSLVSFNITDSNGIETVDVKIKNPTQFKLQLQKTDIEGNELEGAVFDINGVKTQGEAIYTIENSRGELNKEYKFVIKEESIDSPYINIFKGDNFYRELELTVVQRNANSIDITKQEIWETNTTNNVRSRLLYNNPIYNYIDVKTISDDGIPTVQVNVINPMKYNILLEKEDTAGNKIPGTKLSVTSSFSGSEMHEGKEILTDENGKVEFTENGVREGIYIYKIKEEAAANERYVNILEGYYIKVELDVRADGVIRTLDSEAHKGTNYYEIYKSNQDGTSTLVERGSSKIYDYVSVEIVKGQDSVHTLKVKIKNPVTFNVEVNKKDSADGNLEGAKFEITSDIVKDQQAMHKDEVEKDGIDEIKEDGTIKGTTKDEGNIKFGETWVNSGIYEYTIKETKTPGEQYVNMLEGYLVKIRVKVNGDGSLQIVDKNGNSSNPSDGIFYIVKESGEEVDSETYERLKDYVHIDIDNQSVKATIGIQVENPVKYNILLEKEDTAGSKIPGTKLSVDSTFSGMHNDENTITDENGKVEFTENGVREGTYTYKIKEEAAANDRYVNILEGYYIKVELDVRADGLIRTLDSEAHKGTDYYEIYKSNQDGTSTLIERGNSKIYDYVSVEIVKGQDSVHTLKVKIKNPVRYTVKVIKQNMDNKPIERTEVSIDSTFSGMADKLYTNINGETSIKQEGVNTGIQTYKIREVKSANDRYVNILEGYYIEVKLNVNGDGVLEILDNNDKINDGYYQIYKDDGSLVTKEESKIYKYVEVGLTTDEKDVYVLNVTIKNPITFKVELSKVDTEDGKDQNVLQGADFEIESQIVKEQQAENKEKIQKEGVQNIAQDGKITGTTTEKGNIKFEETWVDSGIYEYVLKENKSPGNQYVNILEGYQVRIYVKVEADGKIRVVNKQGELGTQKFYIETRNGETVDDDTYEKLAKYVHISVENNTLKAVLGLKVENPVRFKVRLYKKVLGIDESYLGNTEFELISEISGSNEIKTDSDGQVEIEESFVSAGDYEYILKERNVPNNKFVNLLGNNYIKFTINVAGDGTVKQNGYEIYDENNNLINKETSIIDENVILDTNDKEDDISIVKIYVSNPQRYNLKLLKTDIDTKQRLNKVEFNVFAYNSEGKQITLKKASNPNENIKLDKLVTGEVDGENGVILIDDILIEKSGMYIFKLQETKPYLWKQVNDIYIAVNIEVENGQYVVKNIQIPKEIKDVNTENSKVIYDENSTTVQIEINNERVKGKYDLTIDKLDSYTKEKIDGAKFKVTVLRDGKESEVYESNNDVTSKKAILPKEVEVTNGTITIKNIRIEKPESYIIRLEEIKAPNTYLDLQEVIELKVTTNLKGEGKDERFVLENVELVSGANNSLVSHKYEDNKITLTVQNEQFDLSLRKFVTKVISNEGENNQRVYNINERIPNVNVQKLKDSSSTTAEYYHPKNTVKVYAGDTVIYTIRVYNEGQVSGYAEEVIDHLPANLEFVNDEFNSKFGWVLDEDDTSLRTIKTNYLSRAKDEKNNLIKAFDAQNEKLDYKEIQIKCKVKEDAKLKEKITNIAEISKYTGENGRKVIDRDSNMLAKIPDDEELPNYKESEIEKAYVPGQEDDDDFEKVVVEEFDLALRKFITKLNTEEVTNRIPEFKLNNGKFTYNHTKEPLIVGNENIVEYTIRVYNEGSVAGYANIIKDDIPKGLVFLPEEDLNKEYRWIMLNEEGKVIKEVNKAKYIATDYLSKEQEKTEGENLLKAFDSEMYNSEAIKEPSYKDVKVAFKVVVPNTSDNIIINKAEIADDSDENGEKVEDIDSTPNKWIDGEDDQDIEKIKVQSFDLSLRKWVTKAIIIEDGKENITETGHKAEDNPEEIVKVELQKSKLDKLVVKFEYKIRVTNEGEIPGYVKEISDYIPEGLRFVAVDNEDWEEVDGKVVTNKLADKLLNPGDSAEVSILLTWINREDNMGLKVNVAEISKDYNKYETPDIDSTPNNKEYKEDDIDDAKVQLVAKIGMPKTGQTRILYILLAIIIIAIVVYLIVKRKKESDKK